MEGKESKLPVVRYIAWLDLCGGISVLSSSYAHVQHRKPDAKNPNGADDDHDDIRGMAGGWPKGSHNAVNGNPYDRDAAEEGNRNAHCEARSRLCDDGDISWIVIVRCIARTCRCSRRHNSKR